MVSYVLRSFYIFCNFLIFFRVYNLSYFMPYKTDQLNYSFVYFTELYVNSVFNISVQTFISSRLRCDTINTISSF